MGIFDLTHQYRELLENLIAKHWNILTCENSDRKGIFCDNNQPSISV